MTDLTIILPFHNEAATIRDLFNRLYPVLGRLGLVYEILCIDDGSTDHTFSTLLHARELDHRVKIIRLARNFGKESALTCGLTYAKGKSALMMDSDLQHPPELIADLVKEWQNGAELVYAIRRNRSTDTHLRQFFSRAFYFVFRSIADIQIPDGAGDFCLLDRRVIKAVNSLPERNRFMKGLVSWVGFKRALVPFDVAPRPLGTSHFSFFRLMRFAIDGLSSFSTLPLRVWTWCGLVVSLVAITYAVYLVLRTLLFGIDVPGYASLMVAILMLGGIQMLGLGVLGEYLARIFSEVKGRPHYFISERYGFEQEEPLETPRNQHGR